MAKLKMLSPWMVFYREIDAMFKKDPEVQVIYDEDAQIIKLFVDNTDKADALAQILPEEKEFGNVTLQIVVIPANNLLQSSPDDLFRRAFYHNEAVRSVESTRDIPGFPCLTYVIFNKEVVQYFTDNLGDYYGITSTLYQSIAKDIFVNVEGVRFCTDVETGELYWRTSRTPLNFSF
jgi:hypothetical protein